MSSTHTVRHDVLEPVTRHEQTIRDYGALGLDEADATVWADLNLDPATARAWVEAGLDPADAAEWHRLGHTTGGVLARHALGVSAQQTRDWEHALRRGLASTAPFDKDAHSAATTPAETARWTSTGIPVGVAVAYRQAGFDPVWASLCHRAGHAPVSAQLLDPGDAQTRAALGTLAALRHP